MDRMKNVFKDLKGTYMPQGEETSREVGKKSATVVRGGSSRGGHSVSWVTNFEISKIINQVMEFFSSGVRDLGAWIERLFSESSESQDRNTMVDTKSADAIYERAIETPKTFEGVKEECIAIAEGSREWGEMGSSVRKEQVNTVLSEVTEKLRNLLAMEGTKEEKNAAVLELYNSFNSAAPELKEKFEKTQLYKQATGQRMVFGEGGHLMNE